jgi:hypothetical protein
VVAGDPYLHWTDSGIELHVFRADANGFRGRWVNGGREMASGQRGKPTMAQGFFCAEKS